MAPDIVNTDQSELWNGEAGERWARLWQQMDRDMAAHHVRLMEAIAVADGDRVLDFGCGNGQTSREVARATPTGSVLGLDLSGPMLERARALAAEEGLTNVTFVQGDAQVHRFEPGAFDLAMSRFGSMFFSDKVAAFTNIGHAVRSGGRLALLVWQPVSQNDHFLAIREALAQGQELPPPDIAAPGPFSLSDADAGRAWLEAAGFVDVQHTDVREPFYAGADADDAVVVMGQMNSTRALLDQLDDEAQKVGLAALHEAMVEHATPEGVIFDAATWIITARRP